MNAAQIHVSSGSVVVTPSVMPAEGGCSSGQIVTPGMGALSSSPEMRSQLQQDGRCDGSPEENEKCKEGKSFMVGGGRCLKSALECVPVMGVWPDWVLMT